MNALSFRALLSGASMFERYLKRLAGMLESTGDLDRALNQWAKVVEEDAEFARWFYQVSVHAWMAGQLMVRAVELDDGPGHVALQAARSFVELSFEEAVAFFGSKQIVSPAAFAAVQGRFRAGAFTARRLTSNTLRHAAHQQIGNVLAGGTVQDAVRAIRAAEVSLGAAPQSAHYITNVVRTNVANAYGAGRYDAMTDPDVMRLRPYWQYVTAGDDRVRDEHAALEGRVFEAGSADADRFFPPLGFQCRCSMVTLSARQLEQRGLVVNGAPPGAAPDPGWEDPPRPLGAEG